jgi:hypothetical protein
VKIITLLTITAVLLQNAFGTTSSVGGPMADLLILLVAMLAVGIYEASVKNRGPLGWMVNIVAALVGGCVAASLVAMAMESILTAIHFQGRLVSSHHPMRYISEAGMAVFTVLGSWITLQILYWFPDRRVVH